MIDLPRADPAILKGKGLKYRNSLSVSTAYNILHLVFQGGGEGGDPLNPPSGSAFAFIIKLEQSDKQTRSDKWPYGMERSSIFSFHGNENKLTSIDLDFLL